MEPYIDCSMVLYKKKLEINDNNDYYPSCQYFINYEYIEYYKTKNNYKSEYRETGSNMFVAFIKSIIRLFSKMGRGTKIEKITKL